MVKWRLTKATSICVVFLLILFSMMPTFAFAEADNGASAASDSIIQTADSINQAIMDGTANIVIQNSIDGAITIPEGKTVSIEVDTTTDSAISIAGKIVVGTNSEVTITNIWLLGDVEVYGTANIVNCKIRNATAIDNGVIRLTGSTMNNVTAESSSDSSDITPFIILDKDSSAMDISGNVQVSPLAKIYGNNTSTNTTTYTLVIENITETNLDWNTTVAKIGDAHIAGYNAIVTESDTTITITFEKSHYWLSVNDVKTYPLYNDPITIETPVYQDGKKFLYWNVIYGNVDLVDPYNATTSFIMPSGHVSIEAVYTAYVPVESYMPTEYVTTTSVRSEGWNQLGKNWYVYENGKKVKGWYKDGKTWYYLDTTNGKMSHSGLQEIDGKDYYFYAWGGMASTFWYFDENGEWYFFGGDGAMKKNTWVEWRGKYYYVDSDGKMLVNTITPDGYKVGADGAWIK